MKTLLFTLLLALATSLTLTSCYEKHHEGDGHDRSRHEGDGHKH